MKILILGASSYTGKCIKQFLGSVYKEVFGTYHSRNALYENDSSMYQYSLGMHDRLWEILKEINPDVIISSLRGDFEEQLEAHKIAADFLKSKKHGKLFFLSTANVFDGVLEKQHLETDTPKSVSTYGNFKIECEKLLQETLGEHAIILRTSEIWGADCPRLQTLVHNIKNGIPIVTYKNIYINYTTNVQIAEWILYILQYDLKGIFHIGTKDIWEYMKFQSELLKALGLENPIFEINRESIKQIQAVIPGRNEIPESMQRTIQDVIFLLKNTFILE